MKTFKFFAIFALVAAMFTSCEATDETGITLTGISINKNNASVEVDASVTLTAFLNPEGATGTIEWASKDEAVATVEEGVVTGVAAGETEIVASCGAFTAKCIVTVTSASDASASDALNGSDYYLLMMDGTTSAKLGSKVVCDLRPNDSDIVLNIWENTYTAGSASGPNSFGEVEGWVSLIVGSVGWSGCGVACNDLTKLNQLAAVTASPEDYYLHFAMKSKTAGTHVIKIEGTSGAGAIAIGSADFNDNGSITPAYADFTRDGEWNHFDIPMTELTKQGLLFTDSNAALKNVLICLSGGTPGVTLDLDAAFIYKK